MTDALLKGAILSQFLKNLAEAVLQMGFRIVTLILCSNANSGLIIL